MKVEGDVCFSAGFESTGQVYLPGARISGSLDCTGARLKAKGAVALWAEGMEVEGNVLLSKGFETTGEVLLVGSRIGGWLDCDGSKLLKHDGYALHARGARIDAGVFMGKGFESTGTVCLDEAKVGVKLAIQGAQVANVSCSNLHLSGDLIWVGVKISERTNLDLTGAKVKNFHDDRGSWPNANCLILDGLTYDELTLHRQPTPAQIEKNWLPEELEFDVAGRVEWIGRQRPERCFEPQPWVQLSKLLEGKGDQKGAKRVIYEFHRLKVQRLNFHPLQSGQEFLSRTRRLLSLFWSPSKAWPYLRHPNRCLGVAFAWLKEAPLRIVYSIAFFLALGWIIFNYAGSSGALAPTEPGAYMAFVAGKPMPAAYPALNPFVYTLENAVPLVKLGQDDKWAPDRRHRPTDWFTGYWFLMWARWGLILSGWFQATVLASALVNRFKP